MRLFKRYSRDVAILFGLAILFFALRLYHLGNLPLFTDEAIYIRWAQIAKQDAAWRFISLTDGKQPMFTWFVMIALKFFKDPLIAGRMVSVGAGCMSMIGMYFFGSEIFRNRKIGLISSSLYVLYPFALVYDRMALYDSLVGMFAVWSLFLLVKVVRSMRLDMAMILGLVSGGGVLNKTSGFFTLYLLPLTLFLFDFKKQPRNLRFVKLIGLWIVITILTYLCYSILRLSPFFHIVDDKNALFVFPLREWIQHPFQYYGGNLNGMWSWYLTYATVPLIFITAASFIVKPKNQKAKKILIGWTLLWLVVWILLEILRSMLHIDETVQWIYGLLLAGFIPLAYFYAKWDDVREKVFLVLWFLIPFTGLVFFGRIIYPRFIFFMTLALLPLAAYTLYYLFYEIKNKIILSTIIVIVFWQIIRSLFMILTSFATAPIPYSDLTQYNNDWFAGGGVKEAVAFFQERSQNQKIYIVTEGTFGLMPFGLEIYLKDNPNVAIKGLWPVNNLPPDDVVAMAKKMPTYAVFYQPCPSCVRIGEAPPTWPATLELQYKKYLDNRFFSVYQIHP